MVSFYGFYTTWTFLVGIASIVSLGFITNKYHIHANKECYVDVYKVNYDLYDLVVFLLASTIFTSFIQTLGYCGTYNSEKSCQRNIINILIGFIFIVQILSCCSMVYKFDKNNDCYNFYKDEVYGKPMLITFIGLCISYILQILFLLISLISMCFCERKKRYNYYQFA
jgi:hypothetical protein